MRVLQGRPGAVLRQGRRHDLQRQGLRRRGDAWAATASRSSSASGSPSASPTPSGLDVAAPLLCAGITTYTPLKRWGAGPGTKVAVVGLGGLGHLGVKFAAAMGAEVTVLSQSTAKAGRRPQASAPSTTAPPSDESTFEDLRGQFDLILNTVSADLPFDDYLSPAQAERRDGQRRAAAERPQLVPGRSRSSAATRSLAGSNIGGIAADPGDARLLRRARHRRRDRDDRRADQVNEAYDRVVDSDVRYRFVIDTATIGA